MMERIEKIREVMDKKGVDCFFISSLPDTAWLASYGGTAAYIAITKEDAIFITDGRYETYCKEILDSRWDIFIVKNGYDEFFDEFSKKYNKIMIQQSAPAKLWNIFTKNCNIMIDSDETTLTLRMVKTKAELLMLKDEYDLAGKAFLSALKNWRFGQSESLWAAELEYQMKAMGAVCPSFQTITASGVRGALPHGLASSKIINENEAVTIDFGSKKLYNSDYTRVVYNGNDSEILNVIDIVRIATERAIEQVAPGKKGFEIDAIARDYIDSKGFGEYFIHNLGHGVGAEVHELPRLGRGFTNVLGEGMVFTIEPGIYLPGKFGIRLEQTVAVTSNGCDLMSSMLDKYVYRIDG